MESLHDKLSELGADVVLRTVNMIDKEDYKLIQQDNSLATPAPKIKKETCRINWNKSAEEIHNLIRGLSPIPGAFFEYNNKTFKVYKSKVCGINDIKPGELRIDKSTLLIGCGKSSLEILEIQQEGHKRLKIEEFLRGFRL